MLNRLFARTATRGAADGFDNDDVLANAPIGVYTSTLGGRYLAVNPAMAAMFGYDSPADMVRSVTDIAAQIYFAPEDRDDFIRRMEAEGRLINYECRFKRRDGSTLWVSSNARAMRDKHGRVSLYQGFMTDISHRKAMEEALVESEQRHRIIFENSPLGMILFDSAGSIIDCNDVVVELMASSRDRLIGFSAAHLESPIARAGLKRALDGKSAFLEGEYTSVTGGTTRVLRANFKPIQPGQSQTCVIATLEDISERSRMERAVRESEDLQRVLLDILPIGVVIVDGESRRIERANEHVAALFGAEPADLIGRCCHELLCPTARGKCPVCDQGMTLENSEREMLRSDGSRLAILKTVKRVNIEGREKLLECFVDVSDRKKAEQRLNDFAQQMELKNLELEDARLRAEQAARDKSDFLSRMSHEIRTPLNGVIGMTGLLMDTRLDETQRRYVRTLKSSGESLLAVVNDILDLSRIESGRLELESLDFDLRPLLDDVTSMLAVKAAESGIEFICSADPDVPEHFRGEPALLRQVVTNLAGNAIKFTPEGEVEVRVSMVHAAGQQDAAPATLLFSVRDTGIGIPEDMRERLFEDYTQADASIARRFGGTGLGLSISKKLVELMGGEIGVQSVLGRGSTFWFTIRLEPSRATGARPFHPAGLEGLRVLVVDDNVTNREILMARFSAWGMRPDEAEDGPGALDKLARAATAGDPFRLAVLDHCMPVMDGESLGRAIHADDMFRGTRTLLMTSLGQRGDARRFRGAGFSGYLCKPVLHGELKTCLNIVMGGGAEQAFVTRHVAREVARRDIPDFSDRNVRILLVEDNVTNQQVALGILSNMGLKADAAENGSQALEALSRTAYDLVLMDVQMPVMDGFLCTRLIRDHAGPALDHGVPIIAMTAHAQAGFREKCLEAGMNDYVPKPIALTVLAEALQAWLPGGERRRPVLREAPATDGAQRAVWDRQAFMGRILDDEDLARDIVGGFRADAARRLDIMRRALSQGDFDLLASQAHSIKGASANLGANRLREAAMTLETVAGTGRVDACRDGLDSLSDALERLLAEFRRTIPEGGRQAGGA